MRETRTKLGPGLIAPTPIAIMIPRRMLKVAISMPPKI
jgi:hypothetical protein